MVRNPNLKNISIFQILNISYNLVCVCSGLRLVNNIIDIILTPSLFFVCSNVDIWLNPLLVIVVYEWPYYFHFKRLIYVVHQELATLLWNRIKFYRVLGFWHKLIGIYGHSITRTRIVHTHTGWCTGICSIYKFSIFRS